jgi:hypothetical protein
MIHRVNYNSVCVEGTVIVNSHEILAVLLVWDGKVASGLVARASCTMSLFLRVMWSRRKGTKDELTSLLEAVS